MAPRPKRAAPVTGRHEQAARRRLAEDAAHDDDAWNELVTRLTPVVEQALDQLQTPPHAREQVSRDVWRALAERVELRQTPPDPAAWLRDRVGIEAERRAALPSAPTAEELSALPPGIAERRLLADRRRSSRSASERRAAAERPWSPELLAAYLRS